MHRNVDFYQKSVKNFKDCLIPFFPPYLLRYSLKLFLLASLDS